MDTHRSSQTGKDSDVFRRRRKEREDALDELEGEAIHKSVGSDLILGRRDYP